jgi:hypothetical protein
MSVSCVGGSCVSVCLDCTLLVVSEICRASMAPYLTNK